LASHVTTKLWALSSGAIGEGRAASAGY